MMAVTPPSPRLANARLGDTKAAAAPQGLERTADSMDMYSPCRGPGKRAARRHHKTVFSRSVDWELSAADLMMPQPQGSPPSTPLKDPAWTTAGGMTNAETFEQLSVSELTRVQQQVPRAETSPRAGTPPRSSTPPRSEGTTTTGKGPRRHRASWLACCARPVSEEAAPQQAPHHTPTAAGSRSGGADTSPPSTLKAVSSPRPTTTTPPSAAVATRLPSAGGSLDLSDPEALRRKVSRTVSLSRMTQSYDWEHHEPSRARKLGRRSTSAYDVWRGDEAQDMELARKARASNRRVSFADEPNLLLDASQILQAIATEMRETAPAFQDAVSGR